MAHAAWLVTVALVLLVGAVFVWVVRSSSAKSDYEPIATRATKLRPPLLLLLSGVVLVVFVFTLRALPYGDGAAEAQVVQVTGSQWSWQLSRNTITTGTPVEFQVTSADVNHGFGIYDSQYRLLAQVQAMPKYVNHLRYTFAAPGTYHILCLEYCGRVHHGMMTDLVVTGTAADTGVAR